MTLEYALTAAIVFADIFRLQVAWNAYLSWSCGGVDPAQSSPQLSAAEPTVDDWWTAVPCAHKVTHTPEGLSAMHVLSEARQLVGMERVLNSWGLQVRNYVKRRWRVFTEL